MTDHGAASPDAPRTARPPSTGTPGALVAQRLASAGSEPRRSRRVVAAALMCAVIGLCAACGASTSTTSMSPPVK
ncbi:MAG: hypothetical protein QOK15_2681, partial [Nocardioidaceae bacterium]|nr:hypothetical protein [Nocardioidaceae bacterium]